MKTIFYAIDCDNTQIDNLKELSREEWITESERQNNVFTPDLLVDWLNDMEVNTMLFRLYEIETL